MKYCSVEDLPWDFTIENSSGKRCPLPRFEVSHADKTLGVFLSMDGNEEAKIYYLTKLSRDFGNQLRTSKCDKNAAIYTLQFSFMKTLEYPMAVTQLDESTCNRILAPALTPALHKAGC